MAVENWPPRLHRRRLVLGLPQRPITLQRELRVQRDRPRRIGQQQQAIHPLAAIHRRLEAIGRRRQRALHQILHLDLAEGAARLLVGQDVLQPHNLGRQFRDILLRRVDHGQPLPQIGQRLGRLRRLLLQLVTYPLAQRRQPLLDALDQGPLLGLQPVGQR